MVRNRNKPQKTFHLYLPFFPGSTSLLVLLHAPLALKGDEELGLQTVHNTLPRLLPHVFSLLQHGSFPQARVLQGKNDLHGLSRYVSFLLDKSAPVYNPPWEIPAPPWSLPEAAGLCLLRCLLPSPSLTLVSAAIFFFSFFP